MDLLRKPAGSRGFTLIELMIATFLSLIVVLALGNIVLANQKAWVWGHDKAVLQSNVTESLEWMARSIRAAHSIQVLGSGDFQTYDENDNPTHRYRLSGSGASARLLEDESSFSDRTCTQFTVTANTDTTSLTLALEFEDDSGARVAAMNRATLRNRTLEF